MPEDENKLYLMLGEMQGMLKSILTSLESTKEDHRVLKENTDKRFNNHSDRLSALEKFRWQIAGMVALVPFLLTIVGWLLFK